MPARREMTMRQIKQMLRLARDGVSSRETGRTLGIARSTVQDNLARASAAGLTWPLGPEVTDAVLEQRLFARAGVKPDWPCLIREMRRPGVNRDLESGTQRRTSSWIGRSGMCATSPAPAR